MKAWGYVVIAVLALLVVVAGIGGYVMGTSAGEARASNIRRQFMAGRFGGQVAGGAEAEGAPRLGLGARPAASGTVKSVTGNTIVVSTPGGDVTVTVAEGAPVMKTVPASIADVAPGVRVTVTGETTAAGTVNARSVQVLPAQE